jgi:class 3 adenylate cyclase
MDKAADTGIGVRWQADHARLAVDMTVKNPRSSQAGRSRGRPIVELETSDDFAPALRRRAVDALGDNGAWLLLSTVWYGWRANYDLARSMVSASVPPFRETEGSTTLAATRPPTEVVALLNRFFTVVVDVVAGHGGFVNKFEGDAALAVFGAPIPLDDAAGQALAAARILAARLTDEMPDCSAGIGVSFGPVVAGNVGTERRFEYTVIGDPVNEAARLTEVAKTLPGRVAASAAMLDWTSTAEAARWKVGADVPLRGRTTGTRLATPLRSV